MYIFFEEYEVKLSGGTCIVHQEQKFQMIEDPERFSLCRLGRHVN